MNIIFKKEFVESLSIIENFIAQDSPNRAVDFTNELFFEISKIDFMPYRFRKNKIKNNPNIRDLIFKGYVVVFQIKNNDIIIIDIYSCNVKKINS